MKFGAGFPLLAMSDPIAVRDFGQALDGAGFDFVTSSGHLLGIPAERLSDRPAPTYTGPFHDPFVLFGYLAAITQRLHFRTSVLILPLYPTAIVAKQAAELQFLSDGRFELGVGISWNAAEYQAVGQDFAARGKRVEEQVQVLRKFWSEPYVTFDGRSHALDGVGLNRPLANRIPIWMGGTHEAVLRRAAKLADGWIPLGDPTEIWPRLKQYVAEAGREPSTFGVTGRVTAGPGGPQAWVDAGKKLQELGATHLTLSTPSDVHGAAVLDRLVAARQALGEVLG
jgi:probable F420-dependent oxidoreductase